MCTNPIVTTETTKVGMALFHLSRAILFLGWDVEQLPPSQRSQAPHLKVMEAIANVSTQFYTLEPKLLKTAPDSGAGASPASA